MAFLSEMGTGQGAASRGEGARIGAASRREETRVGTASGREETRVGTASGREETTIGAASGREETRNDRVMVKSDYCLLNLSCAKSAISSVVQSGPMHDFPNAKSGRHNLRPVLCAF